MRKDDLVRLLTVPYCPQKDVASVGSRNDNVRN
jgi:hypothetical protein